MQDDKGMATFEYFIHLRYQSVFFWAAILIGGLCMRFWDRVNIVYCKVII